MALNQNELNILMEIQKDAAATKTEVSGLREEMSGVFRRLQTNEHDITEVQTYQKGCNARKAFDAGVMPGDKSSRFSNVLAIIAIIISLAVGAAGVIVAVILATPAAP